MNQTSSSEHRTALMAIIVTVLFWGFSFISIKIAVPVLQPMTLGAVRFGMAVIFLYFVKRSSVPSEKFEKRDIPYLAGAGLIGVTAYFYFENNGVLRVSASEASIIIAAIPVLTMIAERLGSSIVSFKAARSGELIPVQRIAGRRWVGAGLSGIGVWLVAGATIAVSGSAMGYLFMIGAALSWVSYTFLTRPLFARRSRIYIVFWQSVFGFLGFIPFALLERPNWGSLNLTVILHVVYLGIFCSALGYWFYARALQSLGIASATVFINLIPVVTVISGFIVLHERLAPIQWAGAASVLAGVYLATYEGRRYKTSQGLQKDQYSMENDRPKT